jgi:hypothetical protein
MVATARTGPRYFTVMRTPTGTRFFGLLLAVTAHAGCGTSSSPVASGDGGAKGSGASSGDASGVGASSGTGGGGTSSGAGDDASGGGSSPTDAGASGDATTTPTGAVYPEPGERTGSGVLPPAASTIDYEGKLLYDNPNIVRDLGYSGVVNGQIVWTFGDTLVTVGSNSQFAASDSAALGDLANPLEVHDKALSAGGLPLEWIPLMPDEQADGGLGRFAEGGTNVVEYAPNEGLVWFLQNDRMGGVNRIEGAGVATVTADPSGPRATRMVERMWGSDEPNWGDVGVTYDPRDGKVYVFGHGSAANGVNGTTFLARVPATRATDISAYEYWDQSKKSWTTTRFGNGTNGTQTYTTAQALFTNAGHGQSNAFWSNYYNTWMFVYGADWPNSDIYVSTAPNLEGPWTTAVDLATTCPTDAGCSNLRYCIAPHPEFDPTGKTLLVTWTDSNNIYADKITWK